MRDYNIESDLKQEKFEVIKLVQGDKGNKLTINVLEDGKPVSLTGCSITAKYKRADGQVINGSVTNISNNSFDAVIDSDITKVSGVLKMLFSIEKDDVKVSTFLLLADVREGLLENTGSSGGGEVTVDLKDYQKKTDNGLETKNKYIVGAINEVNSQCKDIANELDKIVITGGGLSTTEKNLILTLFKNATYSVDMSNTVNTLETLFNGGSTDNDTYTITNNLTNVSTSNTVASINKGSSYTAILTPNEGYTLGTIVVTMGGIDVTSSVVSNNTIEISSVTGNIVITASNTQSSSESTNWTNEVPYKITPINSEYINKDNGEVVQYEGWARTDYLGCYGASKIKIVWTTSSTYGAFYDINKQFIFNFNSCINQDESVAATIVLNVPENAGYFRASNSANALTNATITPYA